MENEKKSADEFAKEHFANKLLNVIIAKTYARHSLMTEEEFLKDIGFEGSGKTEDEAIRISIYNLLIATTNQLLQIKNSIKYATELLKTMVIEENITKEKGE